MKKLDPGSNQDKILSKVLSRTHTDVGHDGNWMVKNNSPQRAKPLQKESPDQTIKKKEDTEGQIVGVEPKPKEDPPPKKVPS